MAHRPHQMVVAQLLYSRDENAFVIVEFDMDGEAVGCTPRCKTAEEANLEELYDDPDHKHRHPAWHPVANLLRES